MTFYSDVVRRLDDDLAVSFGYLDHLHNNTCFRLEAEYILFVSKSNNFLLSIGNQIISMLYGQMILLDKPLGLKVLAGEAIYIGFNGNLPRHYIHIENVGEKLEFIWNNPVFTYIDDIEALDKDHVNNKVAIIKLGFSVLIELWSYKKTMNKKPRIIVDAVTIIESEYQYLQGIDDLADRMGLSKSYLIRLFSIHMGITPGRFMEKYRIQKAKSFLLVDSISIEVVAQMCGFSSANYFSKVFKKCVGISPSDYIKQNERSSDNIIPGELYL